jgi:xylulokinase
MTFIALDLGTSSLKTILVDENRHVLAEHRVKLQVHRARDGWVEQDPQS